MPQDTKTLGPRLAWAAIAALLVAIAGLLTFYDSPKVFGQDNSASSDAALSALTLSGIDFGTFGSETLQYTAQVASSVTQTTVTPTLNHSGASYVIKLGGVTDEDGEISLSVGSNVITVEVIAEDGETAQTYTVTVTRQEPLVNICDRTAQVGATILASSATTVTDCALVPASQLAAITTLDLEEQSIKILEDGDFVGLTGLRTLLLEDNELKKLPKGVLDPLTSLTSLDICGNPWKSLRGKVFRELSNLERLHLYGNNLRAFPVGIFDQLTSLRQLLIYNSYSLEYLRQGVFDDLTSLEELQVSGNVLGTVPAGVFDQLTNLQSLRLASPKMTALPTGVFDRLTSLRTLDLAGSGLRALRAGVFDELGSLTTLDLTGNPYLSYSPYLLSPLTGLTTFNGEAYTRPAEPGAPTGLSATFTAGRIELSWSAPESGGAATSYRILRTVGDADQEVYVADTYDPNGVALTYTDTQVTPGETYQYHVKALNAGGSSPESNPADVDTATSSTDATSTDATLSGLRLSGIDFGTFASGTTSYTAPVANSVSQTTVSPTVNHSGASYVIKLDGVEDADGVVSLSVGSNVITVEVTAEDDSTTQTYTVTVTRAAPPPTDATLSGLRLSGIDFGTFASGTTSYTAQVANSVSQTTVTPTVNDSGASYVIKLGGVTDTDGVVSLIVGSNAITVEVTAEDDSTTQTYTVTVTRAAPPPTDATLSGLRLSGIDFGTFASGTISYTAEVANSVSQTTVSPTPNHSGASYIIKLGGVEDADGVISLSVGSNVITVEVTAEDDSTTQTYTVTVTRAAPPPTDATLSGLRLSGIDFGTFASGTTSYTAQVANSVSQTTVTPTVNDSGASYVIKLGGVTDTDGVVSLIVGSNAITVEVTAEDDSTTQTYTVTVTRAAPPPTDATLSGLRLSGIDFGTFASGTISYTAEVANSVSQTTVSPTPNHSGASYIIKLGGVEDADGVISLSVGSNVITVEVTAEDDSTTQTYTVTVTRAAPPPTDATLSGLRLSGIDFGTFASGTTSYTAQVANSVSQTTVTPTVNDSGASYVIKLGGVTDTDGVVSLIVGSNAITVEVTAEDDSTTQTYTVTVTRAAPPPTDATLSGLRLSGIDFGTFASGTISYTAEVANSVSQTTVSPTPNHSGASYIIKLGGVEDADGVISLSVGSNVITVEVTAEDDSTTQTYTVTVTRAAPPPTDATLSGLRLSGIDFGTFASGTTSYTAQVANSVSQTTVTPTVNDSGASYVIKLGGVTDTDGVVSLIVGSNAITVEVTAEDDSTTQTYTVTVTRAAGRVVTRRGGGGGSGGGGGGGGAPANRPPRIRGEDRPQYAENGTGPVVTYTVADPDRDDEITWSLEGRDSRHMELSQAGVLSFKEPPDYEKPVDSRFDNTYEITLRATDDGSPSQDDIHRVRVTITNVNEPPLISGPDVVEYEENGEDAVGTYTAADPEGVEVAAWERAGDDAGLFSISDTGELAFSDPPDYEAPLDADEDNVYSVTIQATDASDVTGTLAVAITVTDAYDGGIVGKYDMDGNGIIDRSEAVSAVSDYFADLITKAEAVEVITLYFIG